MKKHQKKDFLCNNLYFFCFLEILSLLILENFGEKSGLVGYRIKSSLTVKSAKCDKCSLRAVKRDKSSSMVKFGKI